MKTAGETSPQKVSKMDILGILKKQVVLDCNEDVTFSRRKPRQEAACHFVN